MTASPLPGATWLARDPLEVALDPHATCEELSAIAATTPAVFEALCARSEATPELQLHLVEAAGRLTPPIPAVNGAASAHHYATVLLWSSALTEPGLLALTASAPSIGALAPGTVQRFLTHPFATSLTRATLAQELRQNRHGLNLAAIVPTLPTLGVVGRALSFALTCAPQSLPARTFIHYATGMLDELAASAAPAATFELALSLAPEWTGTLPALFRAAARAIADAPGLGVGAPGPDALPSLAASQPPGNLHG